MCDREPQMLRPSAELFPQLAVHASSEHFDRRALVRVGKIEADDFGRLACRRVVELENCVTGRLEEAVAGLEQLNWLAFQLKVKASGRHHADGRDRMAMQSGRLSRREFDPRAFDQANGRVRGGSSSSRSGSRLRGGKGVSAMADPSPRLSASITVSLQNGRMQREVGVSEAVLRRPGLMPVGVDERRLAHLVEARALIVA